MPATEWQICILNSICWNLLQFSKTDLVLAILGKVPVEKQTFLKVRQNFLKLWPELKNYPVYIRGNIYLCPIEQSYTQLCNTNHKSTRKFWKSNGRKFTNFFWKFAEIIKNIFLIKQPVDKERHFLDLVVHATSLMTSVQPFRYKFFKNSDLVRKWKRLVAIPVSSIFLEFHNTFGHQKQIYLPICYSNN